MTIATDVFITRLLLAAGLSAALGLEREIHRKPAGLRTNMLIGIGAMLFTIISIEFGHGSGTTDRVAAQLITGIGFLGAGVILTRENKILGVTSAATIWLLAAVGGLIGLGHLSTAFVISLATLGVLIGIGAVEDAWARIRRDKPARILENLEIDQ